ncbi:NAD-dependent dehydratase [Xylanimonas oleitrophica]|uniref:NAD-dependent dehydratase n=1 Tax=Xylanimonas oleitrophica TaxID=2607479 RepID=A0A2W5WWZ6_9MICO|nr:SDR family oxidoreductase [Xylanimonas oleitrophica]PZR52836.1 NAD-dependent dehydratase [Xylanimonas oleitrophica]
MAKIVVVGGHGKVALLAEPLLVRAGHEVDALIRRADQAGDVRATGANPVLLDVEDASTQALTAAFAGADVVVWSAGAGGGNPARTYAVDRDAAIRSVDAALAAGVGRYVMVSYFGARPDHGVPESDGFFAYAESKAAADEHVRAHAPGWTILGPSGLTDDPGTGAIAVDEPQGSLEPGTVPRADVAAVVAAVAGREDLVGRTVRFNAGTTPIDEALSR